MATVTAAKTVPVSEPVMVRLPTGPELATWTLPAKNAGHETPVIFVHGGPGMYTTAGAKEKGAALRAAGFDTIYFDQAGGGKSRFLPAAEYTIERAVADLEALRSSLGHDKIILWGSSYGATLTTIYASRFPQHVAAIILTSPGPFPGTQVKHDYKITDRDKVKLGKELSAAVRKIDGNAKAAEATLSQADAGRLFDDLVNADLMGGMVCKGANISAPPPGTGGNLYANRLIGKQLGKLKFKGQVAPHVPVMILRGSCDFLPATNAVKFGEFYGSTVSTIAGTGHGMLENRPAIDAAFGAFVHGQLATIK
jgi:pimeloyl-ACP methyl ester carboxylesterase